jgi:hypothetical protein
MNNKHYRCPECDYEMDREELESANGKCPSCESELTSYDMHCCLCKNYVEDDNWKCNECLQGQSIDDKVHEALNGERF